MPKMVLFYLPTDSRDKVNSEAPRASRANTFTALSGFYPTIRENQP